MMKSEGPGATNAPTLLDITRTREVQDMPDNRDTIARMNSASNSPKEDTWKNIGALAAALVEKAKGNG
jgi:hypothetical protein